MFLKEVVDSSTFRKLRGKLQFLQYLRSLCNDSKNLSIDKCHVRKSYIFLNLLEMHRIFLPKV